MLDPRVIRFLGEVGTGVVDYRREKTQVPDDVKSFQRELVELVGKFIDVPSEAFERGSDDRFMTLKLAHRGEDGKFVYFELDRESAGTRRLLVVLSMVFRALDQGSLLVIDELDASLHTHACELVLKLFCVPKSNPKGAQLIATTHDTNLMMSTLLRRDQLWFTEKDVSGATHLYPLTDIRTRKGDNIEKGYLQGRYGAVPFADPISTFGTPNQE